jgi:HEAT repeat protein
VPALLSIQDGPLSAVARADGEDDDGPEEAAPQAKKPAAKGPVLTGPALAEKRAKVLASLATDENVLINVTGREMPASPDILNVGRRGGKALARCVADNVDDELRIICANMLGRLGDAAALPALHGALEAWDANVRHAAIEALRALPSASNADPLIKLTEREDEEQSNLAAAYRALGATATGKAAKVLRAALRDKDKDPSLREAAFDGLWRMRANVGREAIASDVAFALGSALNPLQIKATRAAAELGAPSLVSALVPLMNHADVRVRNNAVYALGKIGDRAASDALLAQLPKVREARMLNNIAFALERLDPKAFFNTAQKLSEHKQASIRMNTAFVLGDVRRQESVPILAKALGDKNDIVQLSSVVALGKIDSAESEKLLTPLLDAPSPGVRHEAAWALFRASGKKRTDLIFDRFYKSGEPADRFEAALALAELGDVRVTEDVLQCVEQSRCALAKVTPFLEQVKQPDVPGRLMLEWTRGRADLTPLVAKMRPAGAEPLAVSAMGRALAYRNVGQLNAAADLAAYLETPDAKPLFGRIASENQAMVRLHGLLGLGALGDTTADAKVLAEWDNLAASRLVGAAKVLGQVRSKTLIARLTPELQKRSKSSDVRVAMAASAVLLQWDAEQGVFRMLDALASSEPLERDLSFAYLRSDTRPLVTSLLRRAFARESRPFARASLRVLLTVRERT